MPGFNECSIYDDECRKRKCAHPSAPWNAQKNGPNTCQGATHGTGRYDCSCPVAVSGGTQCRTMPSQRPCNSASCVRPECSRARLSASAFQAGMVTDTTSGTNIGSVPPQVDVIKSREDVSTHTVEGLTDDDMERVRTALFYLMGDEMPGTDEYRMIDDLRDKFRS